MLSLIPGGRGYPSPGDSSHELGKEGQPRNEENGTQSWLLPPAPECIWPNHLIHCLSAVSLLKWEDVHPAYFLGLLGDSPQANGCERTLGSIMHYMRMKYVFMPSKICSVQFLSARHYCRIVSRGYRAGELPALVGIII